MDGRYSPGVLRALYEAVQPEFDFFGGVFKSDQRKPPGGQKDEGRKGRRTREEPAGQR